MEFLIVIFLFSGIIKSLTNYFGIPIPVDFTVICSGLLLVGLVRDVYNNSVSVRSETKLHLLFILVFFCFAAFSTVYSASNTFKYEKLLQLFLIVLIAIAVGLSSNLNLKKLLTYFAIFSVVSSVFYSLVVLKFGTTTEDLVYKKFLGLYLSVSFNTGITALIFLFDKTYFKERTRVLVFTFCFLLILLSGARGPLLILVASIVFYKGVPFIYQKLKEVRNGIFIGTTGIVLAGLLFPIAYSKSKLLQHSIWRLGVLVTDLIGNSEKSDSVNTRLEHLTFSFESIFNSFSQFAIGNGIGSYAPMFKGTDVKDHPHNIFLELWFELGLIGLILFISSLLFPLLIKAKKGIISTISWVVLLYILLNYSKSSSYSEIRIGIAFTTLLIVSYRNNQLDHFIDLTNKQDSYGQKDNSKCSSKP